jgi:hypothetical protein
MTRPLFDHLSDVASSVGRAGHVFLFLDFDGTLAPIVEDPGVASMPLETRELAAKRSASGPKTPILIGPGGVSATGGPLYATGFSPTRAYGICIG